MARIGYNYGSAFRGMQNIMANVTCKSAKMRLSDDSNTAPRTMASNSYAIHPTMLDKMIQSLIVANHRGQPRLLRQLSLPTYIQEFSVRPPATESQNAFSLDMCAVITESKDNGSCRGSMVASAVSCTTDDSLTMPESCPTAVIRGLQFSPITLEDPRSLTRNGQTHSAMQLVWKPDIDFTKESLLLCPQAGPEHSEVQQMIHALFSICAFEVRDAAREVPPAKMGNDPNRAHLLKLVRWLQEHPHGNGDDVISMSDEIYEKKRKLLEALESTPAFVAAELLSKCASNAHGIFNGTVNPLELFLEGNALHRLYDWMNSLWSYDSFFELLTHKYGKHLRIIEVGAGTGGLTARVLEHLKLHGMGSDDPEWDGTYVFTDVSSGFFPSAKARFQKVNGIDYRVLDISLDPLTQGFDAEYDLVIASNVSEISIQVSLFMAPNGTMELNH
jgi:hypothetical protein